MSVELAVGVSMLLPLAGAFIVMLSGRNANLRDSLMVLCTLVTFSVVYSLLPHVQAGARPGPSEHLK